MPREIRYCRPRADAPQTLLAYLPSKFTYLSADQWTFHLTEGHVHVNGCVVLDGAYVLQQGDMLRFAPPRSLEPRVNERDIVVLYEDASLLVCAKNGNLPVAEGGRYCENTLIAILQRNGSKAFYNKDTVVIPAPQSESLPQEMHGASGATPSLLSCETAAGKRRRTESEEDHSITPVAAPSLCSAASSTRLYTVQRLDKETSGVLVLCKNAISAKKLAGKLESQTTTCTAAVEERLAAAASASPTAALKGSDVDETLRRAEKTVRKSYTAVLSGAAPVGHTFVVGNYMDTMASHPVHGQAPPHSQLKKLKMCCEPARLHPDAERGEASRSPWGKVACTRVCVLASSAELGLSCVRVDLLTGRSHQIRVHCAYLGYPILGDKLYTTTTPGQPEGGTAVADSVYLERVRREEDPFVLVENGAEPGRRVWCSRHLLHATTLAFHHPDHGHLPMRQFRSSPVDFFSRDARFESEVDARRFHSLLSAAFASAV